MEGDLGAPLGKDELEIMESIIEEVKPYLSEEGLAAIEAQGLYVYDEDKEYSTPTINGKECVYAIYDDEGILKCSIEQAFFDGKTTFRKPISCHLYPLRATAYEEFEALNYDRWHICSPACELGDAMKMPIYRFVKDALVRKYGIDWYNGLVELIENPEEENDKRTDYHTTGSK